MLNDKYPVRHSFEAAQVFLKVFDIIELHPGYQLLKVTVYSLSTADHKIPAATSHKQFECRTMGDFTF